MFIIDVMEVQYYQIMTLMPQWSTHPYYRPLIGQHWPQHYQGLGVPADKVRPDKYYDH